MSTTLQEHGTTSSTRPTTPPAEPARLRWLPYVVAAVLLPLVYLFLVHQVGSYPILVWDEGRVAVNAAEMEYNGKWLVTYFGGVPDMWNTKPPLIIWLEVLSLRLFGYSETAFRLPTMLAAIATAGLAYTFVYRRLRTVLGAASAVLILITAIGYNEQHRSRTGDYDAVLTLFVTVAALAFFRYLETQKRSDFTWVTVALIGAALTKGVAGLFWVPAFLLYAISQRKVVWLLRRPEVYAGAGALVLVVGGYYLAREFYNPGYLQAVSDNELGGRLLGVLNEHQHPWYWFLEAMYDEKFMPWLLLFPLSLVLLWRYPAEGVQSRFAVLTGIVVVVHMLIISTASTKLAWYDMPIYPLAAMLVGTSLGRVAQPGISTHFRRSGLLAAALLSVLFVVAVMAGPLLYTFRKNLATYNWRHGDPALSFGFQTKAMAKQLPTLTTYTLFSGETYNPSMFYYALAAQRRYNHTVTTKLGNQIGELKAGDVVALCGDRDKAAIAERFTTMVLVEDNACITVLLQQKK
ncbi:glycosyltransferase family 39 protein [Microvirga sp. STR05]|uniref:Glycosyltransferase family 39 protein n=1 Tax=Hymenobacter duratus TaxID=2771356 RepID=A0ABR8JMJ2_9BACT|nr:glycosyltransferase family 39 protein [Hymenobacter duratus]MBD2716620.1 glycosyltransferase family 39 protein [Hymenobacter duratus]MBR7951535.1 glycosyltransferase family 39 protein [Microvirga sp. STR05]